MPQLEHIEAIEKRLWTAADTLRANSNYASNEYFMPVMGLVFLRHAYSRYLGVHGLEGDIQKAISYYEDPHELLGKANTVMANPPFNEDEIDADKIKNDPRLPFGLPGVNKKGKVSNGNYIWISYFYSYLNEQGRAGFVMSSQASSAGRGEAKVRQKLIETGDADIMVAIRSNFFYTRTVPCELWFLNRNKLPFPQGEGRGEGKRTRGKDTVMMLDARNIYRKVTRKIHDFSPEQQQNLLAIVWLYRGEAGRYLALVSDYLGRAIDETQACMEREEHGETTQRLQDYLAALHALKKILKPLLKDLLPLPQGEGRGEGDITDNLHEFYNEYKLLVKDIPSFHQQAYKALEQWQNAPGTNAALIKLTKKYEPVAEASRDLIKQTDLLYKLATHLIDACPSNRDLTLARKSADEARAQAIKQLKQVRYFWKQAHWLTERFPEARLRDVEGLAKLVDIKEIEANDWSLTPGRYVGVDPEEEDDDFDFEEALREIHVELEDLNTEAVKLAATIKRNFEELGV